MLEHHADAAPKQRELRIAGGAHAFAEGEFVRADGKLALLRHFQEVQAAQEGGLAGAGGADQGDDLAACDRERDALEHLVVAERLVDVVSDQSTHRCAPILSSTRSATSVSGNSTTK